MSDVREKIRQTVQGPQIAVLATVNEEGLPWARYVMAIADDDLTFRIVTGMQSRKVAQIERQPVVHLTCGATTLESTSSYLQVAGRAEVTRAEAERNAMWNDMLKQYFSGPDGPNYCVIILRPSRIEYMGMDSMAPEVWEA
jgi:general stress protein 26